MLPRDLTIVFREKDIEHQPDQVLQHQTSRADIPPDVLQDPAIETGNIAVVFESSPAHSMYVYATFADLVDDSRPLKVGYCCWTIMRGSRLVVEMVFCFDDMDGDSGFGQEQSEEESGRSRTDDDNLEGSARLCCRQ